MTHVNHTDEEIERLPCECIENGDGTMHLCLPCSDSYRESVRAMQPCAHCGHYEPHSTLMTCSNITNQYVNIMLRASEALVLLTDWFTCQGAPYHYPDHALRTAKAAIGDIKAHLAVIGARSENRGQ